MSPNEDETTADTQSLESAAAEAAEAAGDEAEAPQKLSLAVEIETVGPCKRHVKIRVPRADIDRYYDLSVGELVSSAAVPGFRTGHVPRKLVERRFRKEVADQVKQRVLMDSLDQVAEEHELDAINEPDLRVDKLTIPEEGDFEYEFDVEVRPEFDLPDYSGLTIERPVREITDADIQAYRERFLSQFGQHKDIDTPAEPGDFVVANLVLRHKGEMLQRIENEMIRIRPTLRFQDAEITGFDTLMTGVKAGDKREATATVSEESERIELRGETVQIEFEVTGVERLELPELTKDFLQSIGVESEEELTNEIRKVLERQLTYEQRQRAREQVLEKITESADWDLPESLVRRQVENALRREILEMQQAGFTDQQIRARENELRQRSLTTTRQALKEHFVLDKIAREEKLDVSPNDIETEIYLMAMQRGESPRRVRARLEKQGMIENLSAQILERKAIDVVLSRAVYKDVEAPRTETDQVEAIPHSVGGPQATTVAAGESDEAAEEPGA